MVIRQLRRMRARPFAATRPLPYRSRRSAKSGVVVSRSANQAAEAPAEQEAEELRSPSPTPRGRPRSGAVGRREAELKVRLPVGRPYRRAPLQSARSRPSRHHLMKPSESELHLSRQEYQRRSQGRPGRALSACSRRRLRRGRWCCGRERLVVSTPHRQRRGVDSALKLQEHAPVRVLAQKPVRVAGRREHPLPRQSSVEPTGPTRWPMSARNASLPPDTTRISSVTTTLKPGPCGVESCQMPPPEGHGVPLSLGAGQGSLPSGTHPPKVDQVLPPRRPEVSSKLSMTVSVVVAACELASPVGAEGSSRSSASPRAAPVSVSAAIDAAIAADAELRFPNVQSSEARKANRPYRWVAAKTRFSRCFGRNADSSAALEALEYATRLVRCAHN